MSYQELTKALRMPLGFLLGGLYLVYARPEPLPLMVGAAIALVGVFIRGWASGHIRKNQQLAISGPYAYTRNPLYFGSFLIAAGFAIAAHWSLLLLVIAFFALVYAPKIEAERLNILGRFPAEYPGYAENVPAFFPRPTAWSGGPGADERFSFDLYMKHGEWKAALVYVLAVAWLAFRAAQGNIGL
ncbi:MAG TPA: isoprenylcysteine carboxylmethyltransferase family protein [Gemmatimonadaceae bacterium]|nr:isoprenylcysteine carboxylmethyltransferase family protein [Gemmatimonadaceae bacterium]